MCFLISIRKNLPKPVMNRLFYKLINCVYLGDYSKRYYRQDLM